MAHSTQRTVNLSICIAVVTLFSTQTQSFADAPVSESNEFINTSQRGSLFLNGHYIAPPYEIRFEKNTASVNGKPFSVIVPRESDDADEEDSGHPHRKSTGLNRRRRGGKAAGNSRGQMRSRPMQAAPKNRQRDAWVSLQKNRPPGINRNKDNNRKSVESRQPAVETARYVSRVLGSGMTLVLFDNHPVQVIGQGSHEVELYQTLLASHPTPKQIEGLVRYVDSTDAQQTWQEWLISYNPPPDVKALLTERVNKVLSIEQQSGQHIVAKTRLSQFAYPLTVIGMVLSVIAFGNMLHWTGRALNGPESAETPEAVGYTVSALWLMLGMSAIDLIWTILAAQAGAMRELNPLAVGMIETPVQLACFKVVATLTGLGILYAWRERHQIQQATWWMCLVCVLLTFRWVVFAEVSANF